jgi:hypothetical protein
MLACSSHEREAIDKALVAGVSEESYRSIAARVSLSPSGLLRHKNHVTSAIVKAAERQEEEHGVNLLAEAERVRRKAWELLGKLEAERDYRGAIVAVREIRGCLETLGEMVTKAEAVNGGPAKNPHFDATLLTDEELDIAAALIAKATGHPARNPEAPCRKEATLLVAK